jgi:CubicO group peptidase (beta-lactamase class C family)
VWGGHVDDARTRPWDRDTITNVFSTSKTMTNLCALVLADRGELDLDAPVAQYWPAFKANGKEDVLVRHLLAHTSGLSGWQEPLEVAELYDWERCTALLAAQAPWWKPGTMSGYHSITQGYLVGEVVRRVTGQSLGTFFAEQIAAPLNADFHIGIGAQYDERVAPLLDPNVMTPADVPAELPAEYQEIAAKTLLNPALDATSSRTVEWRRAEIPAANGHGNARSVATVQSAISNLGVGNGVRLLSEAGCRQIFREQSNGVDAVLGAPICFGIGYGLPSETVPLPNPNSCFWGGWGGSLVVNDLDAGMTVAYVMNRMRPGTLGDDRGGTIIGAAYAGLLAGAE